jgi:hypothetical protein
MDWPSGVPDAGLGVTSLGRLLKLSPRQWNYAGRAVFELGRARMIHAMSPAREIIASLKQDAVHGGPKRSDPALVSWAIKAVAARVPWRSDCLLQSMAADRWLKNTVHRS